MLSLLLPLQTSLAYARAVSMMTGKAGLMATRVQPAATVPESSSSAGHHHTADAHAGNAASAFEAEPEAAPEHSSHKKSGNACDSCAKCCLAGAAAPPVIWSQTANTVSARVLFSPAADILSCFIPDGPERPPRTL